MLTRLGKGYARGGPSIGGIPTILGAAANGLYLIASLYAKSTDGTEIYTPHIPHKANYNIFLSSAIDNTGLALGSGNSPESENSYTLDSHITGLTCQNSSLMYEYDSTNNVMKAYIQLTINNPKNEDIVIREIGYFVTAYGATTKGEKASTSSSKICMVDRTVLEEPVTIPAGEAGIVRYSFNYDLDEPI